MPRLKGYKKENPKVKIHINLEEKNHKKAKEKSLELYGKENVSKIINFAIENYL